VNPVAYLKGRTRPHERNFAGDLTDAADDLREIMARRGKDHHSAGSVDSQRCHRLGRRLDPSINAAGLPTNAPTDLYQLCR
jgi:hypothetical protein